MKLRIIIPILLAVGATGCLDMKQDIWINPDGSGRLRFDIGVSRHLTKLGGESSKIDLDITDSFKKAARQLVNDPRLRSSPRVEEWSTDDWDRAAIDLTLLNWRDLPDISRMVLEYDPEDSSSGSDLKDVFLFSLEKDEKGNIRYRQLLPSGTPGEEERSGFGDALLRTFFGEGALTITVHSTRISRTTGKWMPDKASVQWSVELSDLVNEAFEPEAFEADISAAVQYSTLWRVVGVMLVIVVLIAVATFIRLGRNQVPQGEEPVS